VALYYACAWQRGGTKRPPPRRPHEDHRSEAVAEGVLVE